MQQSCMIEELLFLMHLGKNILSGDLEEDAYHRDEKPEYEESRKNINKKTKSRRKRIKNPQQQQISTTNA